MNGFSGGGEAGSMPKRRIGRVLVLGWLSVLLSSCGYAEMNRLEERAGAARTEIEVQLDRRAELVPNLLSAVEATRIEAKEELRAAAEARDELSVALRSGDFSRMQRADAELCRALERLLVEVDRYPDLREDQTFRLLRSQLEETEQGIRDAAGSYNQAVMQYNSFIAEFPQLVTARITGSEKLEPFDVTVGPAKEPVRE